MDVELYVYDLSRGMARQYSLALTGVQIDAIYHTAIVLNDIEYFFGQGVHRKIPGTTHHGRPMKVVNLGKTQLPMEVIEEYVQSLESIYTPESYDLFLHNCNNFSQDLAMFLVGQDIPEEIRTLPETFLKTPIGQMLRGQLDQSMRQMTQAPDAVSGQNAPRTVTANGTQLKSHQPLTNGSSSSSSATQRKPGSIGFINGIEQPHTPGHVYNITSTTELDRLLRQAQSSCAVIFFTSATCPPCKIVYPAYDELAGEAGSKATLIKVDTSVAYDIARKYQIRATPTFITFLRGKKDQEWSGAHEARLRGNVRLLITMANPQHAHASLSLSTLHQKISKPIMYARTPPIDKVLAKIGTAAQEKSVQDLTTYLRTRDQEGLENAAISNLHTLSTYITTSFTNLPPDARFPLIDLIRIASADPRVSSYLATEPSYSTLLTLIPVDKDYSTSPYNLQAVTLQLACNLFSSTIFQESLLTSSSPLRTSLENLASSCMLAPHHNARSLAAALVYNLSAHDHNQRIDSLPDKYQLSSTDTGAGVEAALVQAIIDESDNKDTLHALLMALGLLLYMAPDVNDGVWELCRAMDVREALKSKSKEEIFKGEVLIKIIGEELLAKGGN